MILESSMRAAGRQKHDVLPGDDRKGWRLCLERLASRFVFEIERTNALPSPSSRISFLVPRLFFVVPRSTPLPPVTMQHVGDEMDLHILPEFAGSRLGVTGNNLFLHR